MALSHSFAALKRYSCRQVLTLLRRGPQSVAEIHARFRPRLSRASISQALALLLEADMVSVERQGRQNFYRLRPAPFEELIGYARDLYRDARKR